MAAEEDEISPPKTSPPNHSKAEKLAQEDARPVPGEGRKRFLEDGEPDRGSSEEREAKRRKKTSGQVSVSSPGNVEKSNDVLEVKTKVIGVGIGSGFSFDTTALGSPSPVGITPKFGSFALQINPDPETVAVDSEIDRSGGGDDAEEQL